MIKRVQGFFRKGIIGFIAQNIIQIFPGTPLTAFYGVGDIITAFSAIRKENILTGEKLDKLDVIVYIIASILPGVPAAILTAPWHLLRNKKVIDSRT